MFSLPDWNFMKTTGKVKSIEEAAYDKRLREAAPALLEALEKVHWAESDGTKVWCVYCGKIQQGEGWEIHSKDCHYITIRSLIEQVKGE